MQKEKIAVLGISIGTRKVGLSIIKDGELLDWRIAMFKGTWSQAKFEKILKYIDRFAIRYQAYSIALKVPSLLDSSPGLQDLIKAIVKRFREKGIKTDIYRINDLKNHCLAGAKGNKKAIVEFIVQKFPEVYGASKKESGNRNPYYIPMFEAILASLIFLKKTEKGS